MSDWLDDLLRLSSGDRPDHGGDQKIAPQACVLVSVVKTRGSCPRDAGTRMIVTIDSILGTIGGGHLEFQALAISRELLSREEPTFRIERFPLGARLGQCCGGVAHLSFEYIPAGSQPWVAALRNLRNAGMPAIMVTSIQGRTHRLIVSKHNCIGRHPDATQHKMTVSRALALLGETPRLGSVQEGTLLYESIEVAPLHFSIFGAGHVGKALVGVLRTLPCQVTWIDSRASEFPAIIPDNVSVEISDQPECEVDDLPGGSHVVIMTHSHALDQSICERALRRDDLAWCGLIGSITKRKKFEKRLVTRGLPKAALDRLICPIGIDGITGKHPSEIAIAVAAQILLSVQIHERVAVPDHQAA